MATLWRVAAGVVALALALLTIWSTGPFVFVAMVPGLLLVADGLRRVMPPAAALATATILAAALFVAASRIL